MEDHPDPGRHLTALDEFRRSGLDLERLPANPAKLRVLLDLAALLRERELRVLDVGCGDLSLWESLAPLRDRFALVGLDHHDVDPARARAAALGLHAVVERGDASAFSAERDFDAVVSTQVLDDLRDWRGALAAMRGALKPGATLLLTCDSGDVGRPWRARLRRVPRGPRLEELREAAQDLALDLERLRRYGLRDLKRAQRRATPLARQLALAVEEELEPDEASDWGLLYLRARRR